MIGDYTYSSSGLIKPMSLMYLRVCFHQTMKVL